MANDSPYGVACIRQTDGTMIWVDGAPPDLEIGMVVRFGTSPDVRMGTVYIPPRLVVWRDAEVPCAAFDSVIPPPPPRDLPDVAPPITRFVSPDASAGGPSADQMLALAWREMSKLDR